MKWTRLGIVFFTIYQSIYAQQGYNYPKPQTPFSGGVPSAGRPGLSSPGTSVPPQSSGSQPGRPETPLGSAGTQISGGYPEQPGLDRSSAGYPSPGKPTGDQRPSGFSESSNAGLERPSRPDISSYPGQQSPNRPPLDRPQDFTGTQQPYDRFPGQPTVAQQGYNYPVPQKSLSGGLSGSSGSGSLTGSSTSPGTREFQGGIGYPGSQGRPGSTGTNGYPGSERPTGQFPSTGQQGVTDYPDQSVSGKQPSKYPGVGSPFTSSQSSGATQRPSGGSGRYPEPFKPSYPETGTSRQQSPSDRSQQPEQRPLGPQFPSTRSQTPSSGQTGGYPSSTTPSFDQGYPSHQFPAPGTSPSGFSPQQSVDNLGAQGSKFPSDGSSSTNTQFPFGKSQSSIGGYPGSTSPSGEQEFSGQQQGVGNLGAQELKFPTAGSSSTRPLFPAGKPQSSIGGYPGSTAPSGEQGPTGQQQGVGNIGAQGSKFPTEGSSSPRPQFPSGKPQSSIGGYPGGSTAPSGGQGFPGQQGNGGYPSTGKPFGQFPVPAAQFPGSSSPQGSGGLGGPQGSQSSSPQRPSSNYLPPEQRPGGFPAPTRPQFPSGGTSHTGGASGTVDNSRRPGQSGFQTSYDQSSTSESGSRQPQFSSNGAQGPTGQRPVGYSSTESTGDSQFPLSSGGISRPGDSRRPDSPIVRPGNVPADSRPNFSGVPNGQQIGGGPVHPSGGFHGQENVSPTGTEDNGQYEGDLSAIPGQPDIDYPILSFVPETSFKCADQQYPGYYADVEARCQAFHVCANNITYDFLCPNGTIFHQEHLVCVWWNQFDCNLAQSLYIVNENIYDFSVTEVQQTGGIPVPGPGYPVSSQQSGGQIGQTQGPLRPVEPITAGQTASSGRPGEYPNEEPQIPGTPSDSGRPGGYPSRFPPSAASSPTSGIDSQTSRPGEFPSRKPQRPTGYPSQPIQPVTGSQSPEGYPTGKPQGPRFPPISGTPSSAAGSQQGEYPNRIPQESTFPSGSGRPQLPGSRTQTPNGYPSRLTQESDSGFQRPSASQAPNFPPLERRPDVPGFETQKPNEYPSGPKEDIASQQQRPGGYPSGRPQAGVAQTQGETSGRPQGIGTSGAYPSGTQGTGGEYQGPSNYPSTTFGQTQSSNGYPSGTQQAESFPSGVGKPEVSQSGQPISEQYPSNGLQGPEVGVQRPTGYPSGRPQSSGSSSGSEQEDTGFPSRPGTPFPGSPKPHQPARDYLPPDTRN